LHGFLLVLSDNSNISEAVLKEVERAVLRYRKIAIPFRIEDIELSEGLEYYIGNAQHIDANPLGKKHWIDAVPNINVFDNLVTTVKRNTKRDAKKVQPLQRTIVPASHFSNSGSENVRFGYFKIFDVSANKYLDWNHDLNEPIMQFDFMLNNGLQIIGSTSQKGFGHCGISDNGDGTVSITYDNGTVLGRTYWIEKFSGE
jgi:hypothetical protein